MADEGKPPISLEGKIGIALALLGLFGAGVVIIRPDLHPLGWLLVVVSILGGVALSGHHALELWRQRSKPGMEHKVFAFIGAAVCALGCVGFGMWYFWPAKAEVAQQVTLASTNQPNADEKARLSEFPGSGAARPITIYPPFQAIYEDFGRALGRPVSDAGPVGAAYQAGFADGMLIWTNKYSEIIVAYDDLDRQAYSVYTDRRREMNWFDEKYVRTALKTRRGPVPIGGAAYLLAHNEGLRTRLGLMNWHCYLYGNVIHSQRFEHGAIYGPFREKGDEGSGQDFLFLENRDNSRLGKAFQRSSIIQPPSCTKPDFDAARRKDKLIE